MLTPAHPAGERIVDRQDRPAVCAGKRNHQKSAVSDQRPDVEVELFLPTSEL
jgi:hypothetical protein